MPPGTAQQKQRASQPLSSSKAHKAITCTCTTIKTPSQTCRAFLSVFFLTSSSSLSLSVSASSSHFDACVWALSGHYDLLHFLLRLLRLSVSVGPFCAAAAAATAGNFPYATRNRRFYVLCVRRT